MDQKVVLSCIQPTGDIHLGNYLGAVQNWVRLQSEYKCYFGVVDYHSVTVPHDPVKLRQQTWNMAFQLLACGIEIDRLFIQSLIPEHAELCWLLGCVTAYGDLTRMTQFKDKADQAKEKNKDALVSGGLFYYPVLRGADILIYKADYVPVGKDQEQHLELSRSMAQRFNTQFNKEVFKIPAPLFTATPKILSLADPTKKMSKSLGDKHVLNLFGDLPREMKKVRSAVTDSGESSEMSPGVSNLIMLLRAAEKVDRVTYFEEAYTAGNLKYSELKGEVVEAMEELISPIQERYQALLADKKEIKNKIKWSSMQIRKQAAETVKSQRIDGITQCKIAAIMKIICIGRNYVDHAKELNNPIPSQPLVFMKPSTAMLVNEKPFYYPEWSKDIHYEGELVVKIGKNGKYVQPEFAEEYVEGITVGLDMTARDIQARCKEKSHPWEIAKAFDHSAVIGAFSPPKVALDEISFSLKKNGETVQNGNTSDMMFSIKDIIVYVSQFFKLQMGDLLFTGTPAGVGPIQIGDNFEGFLGDNKVLQCAIK